MESIPILKLYDSLIVSIQTDLHDQIAIKLQEEILKKIEIEKSKLVVIDISALDIVDTFVGRILADTASMATIFNADVVIVGMQPAVSITIVELGIELKNIKSAPDIESAFEKFLTNNRIASSLKVENNDSSEDKSSINEDTMNS